MGTGLWHFLFLNIMEILFISILTLAASFLGSLTGFGFSALMFPILVLFLPLSTSLLFVAVIHLFSEIWKIILFKEKLDWRIIISFGIPSVIFSYFGAKLPSVGSQDMFTRILGVLFIGCVIFIRYGSKLRVPQGKMTDGVGGVFSGFMAGAFGIGGPARGVFLSLYNFPKRTYLYATGVFSIIVDTPRIAAYHSSGSELPTYLIWGFLMFIPLSLVGTKLAQRYIDRVDQERFTKIIAVFLSIIGLKLLLLP